MGVTFLRGDCDAGIQNLFGFLVARFADEELGIHEVGGYVVGVALEEFSKMSIGIGGIAGVHEVEREAVAGEGVVGVFRDELLEQLAAGFLLFCHYVWLKLSPYYSVSALHHGVIPHSPAFGEWGICFKVRRTLAEFGRGQMNNKKTTGNEGVSLKGKPVSASRSEMSEVVLPVVTNLLGKLLGGHVMHLVDIVAAMAASRHANAYVVTASVDYIDFRNSINLGEIVHLMSQVNRVFNTSMEVGVKVYSENPITGERKHTTTAYVTFVALDEFTKTPKTVPPLTVKTAEEKRRWREAGERRKYRLAMRFKKRKREE